jgi:type IV secretion system protein VirD4
MTEQPKTNDWGSAYWAREVNIKQAGLRNSDGLFFGSSTSARWFRDSLLYWKPEGHILTVAGTGSGKGVSTVIPNLLLYEGNAVIIDPKGENYAVTARARESMGHKVICLDPFNVCQEVLDRREEERGSFNPFDLIDTSNENFADEAKILADLLVLRTGQEKDSHWNDKSRSILSGLIMYVAFTMPKHKRHLGTVRDIVMASAEKWGEILQKMSTSILADGLIARTAVMIERMADEERMSVFSAMERHTEFLDSRPVVRSLSSSSFDLKDIKKGKISVYLVLPPAELATYARLLRVWIGTFIRAMVKIPGKPTNPTLFMLDEAANLGRMDLISQGVTYLRGYGVSLWIILQNLSQLEELYGKGWETFIGNTVIQQYFGIQDLKTAEYISKKAGQTTIRTDSQNQGRSREGVPPLGMGFSLFYSGSSSIGKTISMATRSLIMPDEVMRLNNSEAILFVRGHPPIATRRMNYFEESLFSGKYDSNPQHISIN